MPRKKNRSLAQTYVILAIIVLISGIAGIVCAKLYISSNKSIMSQEETRIFPRGQQAPNAVFTGEVYVNMLVADQAQQFNTQTYNVEFEPGARTFWHAHPGGQLLFVTHGVGYYQVDGEAARKLQIGDVVEIPANTKHWHGAAPDSAFTHFGITTQVDAGPAEWLGDVTDQEYRDATK
jgi:quercetin dioxygenase-like cupin family protein